MSLTDVSTWLKQRSVQGQKSRGTPSNGESSSHNDGGETRDHKKKQPAKKPKKQGGNYCTELRL